MSKIIKFFLIILFFFLPLINSRLLSLFWFDLNIYVNWNYEFTKVIFFNTLSWIIILLFFIKNILLNFSTFKLNTASNKSISIYQKKEETIMPVSIFFVIITLIISSLLSLSPYISILWNTRKWHSLIMFINLIWLFIVLLNTEKSFLKKLIKTSIISAIFVSIITIKEYFLPTFNYWDLSNRAIWTFWHPNYIALFILMIIPSLYKYVASFSWIRRQKRECIGIENSEKGVFKWFLISSFFKWSTWGTKGRDYKICILILILSIFTLFLTKSAWGITLFIFYNIYYFSTNFKSIKKIYLSKHFRDFFILFIIFTLLLFISVFFIFPEKLHSFISRFFIWKSILDIIFSNIKIFLFWWWFETLDLIFDNYKSKYLYIFENIWFTADRPHNLLLNIFYNTWIFWLSLSIYFIYKIIKNFRKIYYFEAIILFLLFTIFNFSSIASYLLLILFLAINFLKHSKQSKSESILFWKKYNKIFLKYFIISIITFISIIWTYFSAKFYIAENYAYNKNYKKALDIYIYNPSYYYKLWKYKELLFIEKFKSEEYYISKIKSFNKIEENCKNLVNNFWSTENYFYCWNFLEEVWYKELSINYYRIWLSRIPDLWNNHSKYYNNFFIVNFIDWNRFFSKKYSNINSVLEKVK
jgi:hypothetical protein